MNFSAPLSEWSSLMKTSAIAVMLISCFNTILFADDADELRPRIVALSSESETRPITKDMAGATFGVSSTDWLVGRVAADAIAVVLIRGECDNAWTLQDRTMPNVNGIFRSRLALPSHHNNSDHFRVVVIETHVGQPLAEIPRGGKLDFVADDREGSPVLQVRNRGTIRNYAAIETGSVYR